MRLDGFDHAHLTGVERPRVQRVSVVHHDVGVSVLVFEQLLDHVDATVAGGQTEGREAVSVRGVWVDAGVREERPHDFNRDWARLHLALEVQVEVGWAFSQREVLQGANLLLDSPDGVLDVDIEGVAGSLGDATEAFLADRGLLE